MVLHAYHWKCLAVTADSLQSSAYLGDIPRDGGADERGERVVAHLTPPGIKANLQDERKNGRDGGSEEETALWEKLPEYLCKQAISRQQDCKEPKAERIAFDKKARRGLRGISWVGTYFWTHKLRLSTVSQVCIPTLMRTAHVKYRQSVSYVRCVLNHHCFHRGT